MEVVHESQPSLDSVEEGFERGLVFKAGAHAVAQFRHDEFGFDCATRNDVERWLLAADEIDNVRKSAASLPAESNSIVSRSGIFHRRFEPFTAIFSSPGSLRARTSYPLCSMLFCTSSTVYPT